MLTNYSAKRTMGSHQPRQSTGTPLKYPRLWADHLMIGEVLTASQPLLFHLRFLVHKHFAAFVTLPIAWPTEFDGYACVPPATPKLDRRRQSSFGHAYVRSGGPRLDRVTGKSGKGIQNR